MLHYLRPRREKIFGPAPSYRLDGNAKARVWAAATAYNSANRLPRQHQGPLTWATLRVLRALLWRFHGADGEGRCFPSYERIATAAKCHRDSVCEAIKALEDAGLLSWVHRLVKVRRGEQDLFGHWASSWQVIRTSNGYQLRDPLDREPGRRVWSKSENPAQPIGERKNKDGAPLLAAQVMQKEISQGARSSGKSRQLLSEESTTTHVIGPCRRPSVRRCANGLIRSRPRPTGRRGSATSKPGSAPSEGGDGQFDGVPRPGAGGAITGGDTVTRQWSHRSRLGPDGTPFRAPGGYPSPGFHALFCAVLAFFVEAGLIGRGLPRMGFICRTRSDFGSSLAWARRRRAVHALILSSSSELDVDERGGRAV